MSKYPAFSGIDDLFCRECGRNLGPRAAGQNLLCPRCLKERHEIAIRNAGRVRSEIEARTRKRPAVYMGETVGGKNIVRESGARELREIAEMRAAMDMPAVWRDGDWHKK